MSWHHGNCRGCHRVSDSELCPRCEAFAEEQERRDDENEALAESLMVLNEEGEF